MSGPLPDRQYQGHHLRRAALRLAYHAVSPLLFRLTAGTWPSHDERRQFAEALGSNALPMPPIPQALIAVPALRERFIQMVNFHLIGEGILPNPDDGDIAANLGNPLRFWRGPAVAFLHFERTGGTSLAAALTRQFHPLQIGGSGGMHDLSHPMVMPGAIFPKSSADHRLIWGHYDLPALRRLGSERRIITILREPVARILSLYYFWRSIHPSHLEDLADARVMLAQELDLQGFLRNGHPSLRDSIDNVYVRRLAGLYGGGTSDDPLAHDPESALAKAQDALAELAFVGVCEDMEHSFRGIEIILDADLGDARRLNVSAANPALEPHNFRSVIREDITPEIQDALAHLTRLDKVIYEACAAGSRTAAQENTDQVSAENNTRSSR